MARDPAQKPAPRHEQFLRRAQVAYELGITRHTLRRIITTDKRFPAFFNIAEGVAVIERRDLERWIRLRKMLAQQSARE